jgi:prepilin-type N-terminal cleavage/methylation domain-containing protein
MNMIESRMEQRGQGGFTLIELLVVIAILAVLAGAAILGIGAMRTNAKKTACKADLDTISTAAEAYKIDTELEPTVASLAAANYIKKQKAGFTVTSSGGVYVAVYADGPADKYGNLSGACVIS